MRLELGQSFAEQFLEPWPNRRCVIARKPDGFNCGPIARLNATALSRSRPIRIGRSRRNVISPKPAEAHTQARRRSEARGAGR